MASRARHGDASKHRNSQRFLLTVANVVPAGLGEACFEGYPTRTLMCDMGVRSYACFGHVHGGS